jgi:hypothetical protein
MEVDVMRMWRWCLAVLLLAGACGDDDGGDDDQPQNDASGSIDGASTADAAGDSDAPAPDGGDTAGLPVGGYITLSFQGPSRYGYANFWSDYKIDGKDILLEPLAPLTEDFCELYAIPEPDAGAPEPEADAGPEPVYVDERLDVGPSFAISGGGEMHVFEKIINEKDDSFYYDMPFTEVESTWGGGALTLDIPGIDGKVEGRVYTDFFELPAGEPSSGLDSFGDGEDWPLTWPVVSAYMASMFVLDGETFEPLCYCAWTDDGSGSIPWKGCLEGAKGDLVIGLFALDHYPQVEFNGRGLELTTGTGAQIDLPRTGSAVARAAAGGERVAAPRLQIRRPGRPGVRRPEVVVPSRDGAARAIR